MPRLSQSLQALPAPDEAVGELLGIEGELGTPVTAVPFTAYVAAGYRDGTILLARQQDMREMLVRRAKGAAVAGLAWSSDGRRPAYGTEDGAAGLVDFTLLEERKSKKR